MILPAHHVITPDPAFAAATATALLQHLQQVSESSPVCIGLSGGTTPAPVYREIARLFPVLIGGNRNWRWFQVYERCVPADSPQSNQRLIRETLFRGGDTQAWGRFFPVSLFEDPVTSAKEYQSLLFESVLGPEETVSSLLILGLGEDGHTASLFPGSNWPVHDPEPVFQALYIPHLHSWRLSLTPPAILSSQHLWFLVAGKGKQQILQELSASDPDRFPAGYLARRHASARFFLDASAAGISGPPAGE